MSIKNLDKFFCPDSIAIIGATEREKSLGRILTLNLMNRSKDNVYAVNPNREKVFDLLTFSSIQDIDRDIDLAVIATPARTVPGVVEECGKSDVPASIVISSGFSETGAAGERLEKALEKKREEYGMRILGPNSLGLMRPSSDLNASVSEEMKKSGKTAFISQSGALVPTVLSRRGSEDEGFSSFISVGNMIDVDFGDLINYLGKDPRTRTILMHVESIRNPKKFMSAAKSYSKNKPIILEKPGRYEESIQAINSHVGSPSGDDSIYDPFFMRSGVVRVNEINDLFLCSEALAKECFPRGPNLAIVTNGGGLGVMAIDTLLDNGGKLAKLSESTKETLNDHLPSFASRSNPVDISSEATEDYYESSIKACLEDENVDGVLVIYSLHGPVNPPELRKVLTKFSGKRNKPIIACWMGKETNEENRKKLRKAGIPVVNTPEEGIKTYMYMYEYFRNRKDLYRTPKPLETDNLPLDHHLHQRKYLKTIIERLSGEDRNVLMEDESKTFLQTYSIPVVQTYIAKTPEKAVELAKDIGFPIALKVRSPDIENREEIGAVEFSISSEDEVRSSCKRILKTCQENYPEADIRGISVQKMIKNPNCRLELGSKKHPRFGSVIIFGKGDVGGEIYSDKSLDFPPLNQIHARRLIERTKVIDQLERSNSDISKSIESLQEYLARLSQIVIDFSEIEEMNVDLLGKDDDFTVVDANIVLDSDNIPSKTEPHEHLIIEPYPLKYIRRVELKDGRKIKVRPIKPEDEPLLLDLFDAFSKETWRHRFFCPMKEITHEDIVKYANIDYRREIAIVGELEDENKIIGMGRLIIEPGENTGEFAVVVGDPWQRLGLGQKLLESIILIARDRELEKIWGAVLRRNGPMINLCKKLGFKTKIESEDTVKVILELGPNGEV